MPYLVSVEQHPGFGPTAEARHRQRIKDQVGRHPRLDRPADHFAIEQIDHDGQIQPALGRGDVRDVARPHAIRGIRRKLAIQHVGYHRQTVLASVVAL